MGEYKPRWAKARITEEKLVKKMEEFKDVEAKRLPNKPFVVRTGGNLSLIVKRRIGEQKFKIQLKVRQNDAGFRVVKNWLGTNFNHFLIIAEDNHTPLVAMDWHMWRYLIDNLDPKVTWPPKNPDGTYVTTKVEFYKDEMETLADIGKEDGPVEAN